MKKKLRMVICCIIFAMILGMMAAVIIPNVFAQPIVKGYSDVSVLGDPILMNDVRNTTFNIAVVVENFTNLYGFDIQFNWTTQWISYIDFNVTYSYDEHPGIQPPSPYAGILNSPYLELANQVDENDNIGGAEPGTMAWLGVSSMLPATGFNGSGTICVFTFNVTNQPYFGEAPNGVDIILHFVLTNLADSIGSPIAHSAQDLHIKLYPIMFDYPPVPMLKTTPNYVTGYYIGDTFTMNVSLLGEDGGDLDPFWDVAGCDFHLNFNASMLQALTVTVDPDGDFGDPNFFDDGILVGSQDINNANGSIHVSFFGWGNHTNPVNGTIRIATVTFNVTYESALHPVSPIYLENPLWPTPWFILNADGGIINLSAPIGEDWTTIYPNAYDLAMNITDWDDADGDGELSIGDQLIIFNKATSTWRDYHLDKLAGALQLTQLPFPAADDYVWAASFGPDNIDNNGLGGRYVGTDDPYNGFGIPGWTGNFSLTYPLDSVNQINVTYYPLTPDNYTATLVEGVDYLVHAAEDKIELLVDLDKPVVNEHWVDGVNNTLNGWPAINYVASGIESVYADFNNGTARYARNLGYALEPPSEWWFDPDWSWELEGWWALGYYGGNETWPAGTQWWINYTAASYMTIDYNAEANPAPYYVELEGTYTDFLALGDPLDTLWMEVRPRYSNIWNVIAWDDADSSSNITAGDMITLNNTDGLIRDYSVDTLATDIKVILRPCVQHVLLNAPFYTELLTVEFAGFPHPERTMSPWFGSVHTVPLPNAVENSEFEAIPEFNSIFAVLLLMLATTAIVLTRRLPKKK